MRNLLLTICYDGSAYHGWQVQQNAVAVQQVFQEAVFRVLGQRPDLKGCSRTDTGVHAQEFCISLRVDHLIPCGRFQSALNHFLPQDIVVLSCREAPPDFHARYSCLGKEYVYKIWNSPVRDPFLRDRVLHYYYDLDEERLNRTAQLFLGRHDFSAFCSLDRRKHGDLNRTVTAAHVERLGDLVTFTVAADGFLYNMVRIMTGTLLHVAQGKLKEDDIPSILASGDRRAAGPTAPPQGLYLSRVFYEFAPQGMRQS